MEVKDMRVCFPIEKDEGLSSCVYGHFGSAPMYLLVDTESREACVITNADSHHSHGACKPMRALRGENIDGIVVGNIGAGARIQLKQAGLRVFKATCPTVGENVDKIALDTLPEFSDDDYCPGHGSGGGRGQGKGCCH
jgi:predicted Fe-Mo cluster-binding NifX family protein